MTNALELDGHCPICDCDIGYRARFSWYRSQLGCAGCPKGRGSVPRERALALVLNQLRPNWRELAIHESSPADRGVSKLLREECPGYVGSHFHPNSPLGATVDGYRNENLEAQTFADETFDLVVSLDVFEHLFRPDLAAQEIYRTLKPGGLHICTFPIYKDKVEATEARAVLSADGEVQHLTDPPEYHGNPISGEGALVTYHYGYDIHARMAEWGPFDVSITRFHDRRAGVLGEHTEVVVCSKQL